MTNKPAQDADLPSLAQIPRPSVADQVFEVLQRKILSLDLAPGMKLSEAEVAARMGVSRQPVRDAFYRLSQLGFLHIRPQRATTVSLISEAAILQARFIRTALETETCRTACLTLTPGDIAALDALIADQRAAHKAQDRARFHALDDQFHREICIRSGAGFAWDLIQDSKAHMDRVRMLSLTFASPQVLADHRAILDAIAAGDHATATAAMREHLGRIATLVDQLKKTNHSWFADGGPS